MVNPVCEYRVSAGDFAQGDAMCKLTEPQGDAVLSLTSTPFSVLPAIRFFMPRCSCRNAKERSIPTQFSKTRTATVLVELSSAVGTSVGPR